MNVLDSVVCGLQWVPAKLTHMHMFCFILDKKNHLFLCYSFKALSTKLKVVNKEAAFLFASLFACACLAVYLLASLSSSQRSALLLKLLVANNVEKGTCPKVWVTKFGY